MAVVSEELCAAIPPGRTWEFPRPFFDKDLAFAHHGRGQVRNPTQLPRFAELSGCVEALSALRVAHDAASSAREAARSAIVVATEKAIASITKNNVATEVSETHSQRASTPDAPTPQLFEASILESAKESGTDFVEVVTDKPIASSEDVSKLLPSAPLLSVSQELPDEDHKADIDPIAHGQLDSLAPSMPSPALEKRGFRPHSGIFSCRGAWIRPGMASRRIKKHSAGVTKGDHMWSNKVEHVLPRDFAGHKGVVDVLGSLSPPRLAMTRKQSQPAKVPPSLWESLEDLEARALDACDVDVSSSSFRAPSQLNEIDDEKGSSSFLRSGMLVTSDSLGSLLQGAPSYAGTSDIATTAAGDTEEPSERSFTLRADVSMESLLSTGSHKTTSTFVTACTAGARSFASFGRESVSPDFDAMTAAPSPDNFCAPAPKQPRESRTPRLREPSSEQLSFLRSMYGGRPQRSGGQLSNRVSTPRSPRFPERSLTPLRPVKPACGAYHSQARFERRHLAALATLGQDVQRTHQPLHLKGNDQSDVGPRPAAVIDLSDKNAEVSFSSSPSRRNSLTHRKNGVGGNLSKIDTQLPPLTFQRSRPPSFRNAVCPFSNKYIEDGIMLPCGHHFSAEHLSGAIASSERMELTPAGYLACPLCAATQRYCPHPSTRSPEAKAYPTVFSDHSRAYHGVVHTRNWSVENMLPANV